MFNGKQISDASILKAKLSLVDPTAALDPATKQHVDNQVNGAIWAQNWKSPVRVAVGTNVTLSNPGTAIFDSVTLTTGQQGVLTGEAGYCNLIAGHHQAATV